MKSAIGPHFATGWSRLLKLLIKNAIFEKVSCYIKVHSDSGNLPGVIVVRLSPSLPSLSLYKIDTDLALK
jgi:hypothetical protein